MKLAEILTGPETWCQVTGPHVGGGNGLCLFNALSRVTGAEGLDYAHERDRLNRIIGGLEGYAGWQWNDSPNRTWDEIAAVVDAYDRDRLLNP